jgi:hypothetical protein
MATQTIEPLVERPAADLEALFPGRYLSVTSFKRDGTGVATPGGRRGRRPGDHGRARSVASRICLSIHRSQVVPACVPSLPAELQAAAPVTVRSAGATGTPPSRTTFSAFVDAASANVS